MAAPKTKIDPDAVYVCISSYFGDGIFLAGTKLRGSNPEVQLRRNFWALDGTDDELAAASNELAARIGRDEQARRERDEAARARDAAKRPSSPPVPYDASWVG